ncbi:MAG: peptidoglycan DD-metalloendopeptidase family protein [Flavobacteriaceae bacterium]|nr:peptidoglycan DD-metalloendopeptidase family protein [Flavobacteriaceae bacterium]
MNKIFVIFLLLLSVQYIDAQNINALKKKRQKTQQELEYTNKILNTVRTKQSSSLSRLKVLQQDIKTREVTVQLYRSELQEYQKEIENTNQEVSSLTSKQNTLKAIYGELLNNAYQKSGKFEKWLYIFASQDFAQAYNRYKYYEQFTDYTKKQLETLKGIKDSLNVKAQKIKRLKSEKEGLVIKNEKAKKSLAEKKKEQQDEIRRLKAKEKDLLARLKVQQRRDRNLQKQIKRLIAQSVKKNTKKTHSKADIQLGNSFVSNKGKLPWPAKGFISSEFGEHKHPILKTVKIRNDGIDITTQKGSICKAIFQGEVSQVLSIAGLNNTVIIKHGNYLSVYANLIELQVKKGDSVNRGQALGKIATASDGATVMKLQIWKNTSRQNPRYWLRK